jgi:hypothetical protein
MIYKEKKWQDEVEDGYSFALTTILNTISKSSLGVT